MTAPRSSVTTWRASPSSCASRTRDLLEEFDLTDAAARALKHFSGGMRRRLDLAASLIAQPPLLFLDLPADHAVRR